MFVVNQLHYYVVFLLVVGGRTDYNVLQYQLIDCETSSSLVLFKIAI